MAFNNFHSLYVWLIIIIQLQSNIFAISSMTNDSRTEYYAHWISLMSIFSDEEYYGFNIYNRRLLDIILPGSHHSGMYETAIRANLHPSKDTYFSAISFLNDTNKYIKWSIRQKGSIYDQLLAGCRYLDIRLEKSGTEYYTHHGMLGASLTMILADIIKYMNLMHGEMIIIHLSELIEINPIDLDEIYYRIMHSLGPFIADSKSTRYDITTDTIAELLIANEVQIIVFIDKTGLISTNGEYASASGTYDSYFYNAQDYLVGDDELRINPKGKKHKEEDIIIEDTQQPLSSQTLISNALFQLTAGWDHDTKLNLIYWDINIEDPLQTTQYINNYDSFFVAHNEFIRTLKTTINQYPKIYFGNILIIDFMEYLPIDEIIILNMNYATCFDIKWGATKHDCPQLTSLAKLYKTSGISTACQLSDELQQICPRSCGLCNKWISGVPRSPCITATNCNSTIYKAAHEMYDIDTTSMCHIDNNEDGFCLSPFAQNGCMMTGVLLTDIECDSSCLFDYECISGICSSRDSVCVRTEVEDTTASLIPTSQPTHMQCYCDHIHSLSAAEYRESVAIFRAEDEYFESMTNVGLIPIIIGSCLLGIYCCCCFLFIAYSDWSKYTFCRCFDDLNSKHGWFKWIFAMLLFVVLILMMWQCIEGLKANTSMHNHLFDASQPVSFRSEVVSMLDIATARFENVGDDVVWVASIMSKAIEEIEAIVERTDFSMDVKVDAIYKMLGYIATEYDDFSLQATVVDPLTMQPMEVELECTFCRDITDYVVSINASLANAINSVQDIELMIKQYTVLITHQSDITSALDSFSSASLDFTQFIAIYEEIASSAMDVFEALDTQRVYAGRAIFMAPLFGIALFCIAIATFALIAWIAQCGGISECCFRCTWCSMMCIGSLMMILFGALAIVNTGWADACVYLDALEADPTANTPAAFSDGAKIINACWTGDNLFHVFNLSSILFWNEYHENISVHLNIDVLKAFDLSQLDLFSSEIELMDIDEFHTQSDLYLNKLNQVGPPCTCNCLPWGTQQGVFTRSKFQNGQCFDVTQCWSDVTQFMGDIMQLQQSLSGLTSLDALNSNIPDIDELSTGLPDITDLMSYATLIGESAPEALQNMDTSAISELNALEAGAVNWNEEDLNKLMEINNDIMLAGFDAYSTEQCIEYISLSYGSVMAEYILFNETVSMINKLKDEVYNISQTYDMVFMVGVDIENVAGNITYLITPLLNRFDDMINNYARCGFLGELYGGFKQVTCVNVFDDMTKITSSMMVISILSIIAVLLAMCTQYLFHPVRRMVIYRVIYDDNYYNEHADHELIECPQCGYRFPAPLALHPHSHNDNIGIEDDEHKAEEAEARQAMNFEMTALIQSVDPYAPHDDNDRKEYHDMMIVAFYTFAGHLPWTKYVGLYMSVQELARFLEIVCINESVEDVFASMDTSDGRITFNEWMDYFTNQAVNKRCVEIEEYILKQTTWKLLVKALKIIKVMDKDHSGKLEYNEFTDFGQAIGLNGKETQILFRNCDKDNSGSIDIVELFEWFKERLYQQRDRITSQHTASIQFDEDYDNSIEPEPGTGNADIDNNDNNLP